MTYPVYKRPKLVPPIPFDVKLRPGAFPNKLRHLVGKAPVRTYVRIDHKEAAISVDVHTNSHDDDYNRAVIGFVSDYLKTGLRKQPYLGYDLTCQTSYMQLGSIVLRKVQTVI